MPACPPNSTAPCPVCGFDPRQLLPADAAVAARSLSRRWQELLRGVMEREDAGGALLHRPLPSGSSALEQAGHVAAVFERHAEGLGRIWAGQQPLLDHGGTQASHVCDTLTLGETLTAVDSAGKALPDRIERFNGDDWGRSGTRNGEPVTALELTHEAIHEGIHHLRVVRNELAPLCEHPLEQGD